MVANVNKNDKMVFWGCFIALITTAFGFISRLFLLGEWAGEFNLDPAQTGELAGIGIWPFAVSIIGFSLFIDKIGYKTAMLFSFLGYVIWSIMGVAAFFVSDGGNGNPKMGYQLLYWGSLILGLSNGTVEAYINPVVATMFSKEKTKWLNILHAGWPGGLVIAGLITIALNAIEVPWWIRIGIIAPAAVIFFFMLVPCKFPEQERVASGVSYREMLAELGILGAMIVSFLITLQLIQFFPDVNHYIFMAIGVVIVVAFGLYTRSLGSPLLFFLALIMMPLATTEIGTDGWIEEIMKGVAKGKFDPGLVLVYTSLIMMVLRFFAGPIVHKLSPVGLLIASSILAIAGLYTLSFTTGMMIFAAATLYAFGKTFFWPTMLGIVSEQTPKGGALTLNAMGGIGMLAVGVLGFPYIGALQADKDIEATVASAELSEKLPSLVEGDKLTTVKNESIYEIIKYEVVDQDKLERMVFEKAMGAEVVAEIDVYNKAGELQKQVADSEDPEAEAKKLEAELKAANDDKAAFGDLMARKVEEIEGKIAEAKKEDKPDEAAIAKLTEDLEKAKKSREDILAKLPASVTSEKITAAQDSLAEVGALRKEITENSKQGALANMAIFPTIMLVAYIILMIYFISKGGYKAEVLAGHAAEDAEFTGGVEGPADQ